MSNSASVKLSIEPRDVDLGELTVRRVLPSPRQRAVGPFVFFDHFGPAEFPPGDGIQVRPHPHIGLATVTYLFEGEILHRDSLGIVQPIVPGAVNLMTAGRGVVHSERTAGKHLEEASRAHGIQSWIALPLDDEECEPGFDHYPAADIPEFKVGGVTVRLIMGTAYDHVSPVKTFSPSVYFECAMAAGSELHLGDLAEELAVYLVSGAARVDGTPCEAQRMLILHSGVETSLSADEDARVMVVGGAPVGERHIWWNFVSSSRARIEQAKADWQAQRFDKIPGENEFIPLPE